MTNTGKITAIVLVCAILVLLGAFMLHNSGSTDSSQALGSTGQPATVVPNAQWFSGGETIGQTGTFNQNQQFGICNLIGASAGIVASTTANFDCAVKGIKPGDFILEDPSTKMSAGNIGAIFPIGAKASTTAGFVTFTLINLSGAASTTLGTNVASGTEYVSWR